MLQKYIYLLIFLVSFSSFGQNQSLAYRYFRKGEFEKATLIYQDLYKESPHNTQYLYYLLKCYYETEAYQKAEKQIIDHQKNYPIHTFLWVELGYVYSLKREDQQAKKYFDKALKIAANNPTNGFRIAKSFQDNHQLDYALRTYKLLMKALPRANFNSQIAVIYGEKGDIKGMLNTYLDMVFKTGGNLSNIQRYIGRYLTDDSQDPNNQIFKKLLVKRLQENPQDEWNKLLAWLYLQQKEYAKALRQEMAVHKRSQTSLNAIIDIGIIAFETQNYTTADNAFKYSINNTSNRDLQLLSQYYLLESNRKTNDDITSVEALYKNTLDTYGYKSDTNAIQVSYADFLTFDANAPDSAIGVLENALKNRLTRFQKAKIKIQLADIMVFNGRYNAALLTYSQVQTHLKNHILAQEARYKVARTSYYRGDFDWANIQLKVLKRGTTKQIANDALDLSLLITDNIAQDSIRTALKSYATAALLSYQNKNKEAIDTLTQILHKHKGHPIEDEALFKQATIFINQGMLEAAAQNYLAILALENNDILIDDTLFSLAKLYDEKLNQPQKAKQYYSEIVFNHPSSIYLVTARKRFRMLRGDELTP